MLFSDMTFEFVFQIRIDSTNNDEYCAVPGKGSHNNTFRTLERSLLAADTDGYANAKSGTTRECAGKSSGKVYRD